MTIQQGSIILHPTRGTNSRQLVCPFCNKVTGDIMLGVKEFAAGCGSCGAYNIGLRSNETECPKCGVEGLKPEFIPPGLSLPDLCKPCELEIARKSGVVRDGGVFWECEDCGSTGLFEAGHPVAIEARGKSGVDAPEPCGAEVGRETCPVCLGSES